MRSPGPRIALLTMAAVGLCAVAVYLSNRPHLPERPGDHLDDRVDGKSYRDWLVEAGQDTTFYDPSMADPGVYNLFRSARFPAQPELRVAMDDPDPNLRAGALMVYAHWLDKDPATIEPETQVAADARAGDTSDLVRMIVATTTDNPEIVFEAMFDRSYAVRVPVAANYRPFERMRRHYAEDPDGMKALITAACRRDKDIDWVRSEGLYCGRYVLSRYCAGFGPSIEPHLLALLEGGLSESRRTALYVLSMYWWPSSPDQASRVAPLLDDWCPLVRAAARDALSQLDCGRDYRWPANPSRTFGREYQSLPR